MPHKAQRWSCVVVVNDDDDDVVVVDVDDVNDDGNDVNDDGYWLLGRPCWKPTQCCC